MAQTYFARIVTILGDVARRGRTGSLLLDSRGEAGGVLRLQGGLLASFQPAPSAGDGAPASGPGADDTPTGLRQRIVQAAQAASSANAGPAFHPDETAATPAAAPSPSVGSVLTAADLTIDLGRLIADTAWLTERLSVLASGKISMAAVQPAVRPHLSLGPGEGYLLSRADGSLTVREVLDSAPLGAAETLRALFSLISVGLLASTGARADRLESFLQKTGPTGKYTPEQLKERDELMARCRSMKEQDHYAVLGVEPAADESIIRHAYYRLARSYHPDRLLKPHLEDIHRELEVMFAVITDAYNTLSEPALRGEFDRERSERLAGRRRPAAQDKHTAAREAYMRGRKEAEAGRHFEAIRLFETAVQNDPTRAEYFHHLGVCQGQNPRWRKKAEENLLQSIALNPGAVRSYLELARVYQKGGLGRRALDMYQKVLEWEPANEEALSALGRGKEATGTGLLGGLFKKE